MKVERQIEIAAPPARVHELVMDPRRLEEWVTIHHSLVEAPDGPLKEGSKLSQSLKLAGQHFTVRWTIVQNEPAKRVVWEGRGPVRSRARVVYEFQPNADGTRFSYANEYHLPGGPLARMAGPAIRRITGKELDGSLKRLKELLE